MSVNEFRKKRRILLKFIGALPSLVKGASIENLFELDRSEIRHLVKVVLYLEARYGSEDCLPGSHGMEVRDGGHKLQAIAHKSAQA